MTRNPRVLTAWLGLCVIWGTTWMFMKIALQDVTPLTFASARMGLTAVVLMIVLLLRSSSLAALLAQLGQMQWGFVLLLGCLQIAVPFGLNTWATKYSPSSLVAILFSVHPLFVIVLAHLFIPGESLSARRVLGSLCGMAGVAAICWKQVGLGRSTSLSVLAIVISAFSGASANVIAKRNHQRLDPIANTAFQMLVGAIILSLVAFRFEQPLAAHFTPRVWGAMLYLVVIGTALSFVLFYWLMKRIEVTFVSFITVVNTFVAALLGWAVMDEQLGWHTLLGGLLILAGIVLVIVRDRATAELIEESAMQET